MLIRATIRSKYTRQMTTRPPYYRSGNFLLQAHALCIKKWQSHLPTDDRPSVQRSNRAYHKGIGWWHACEGRPTFWPSPPPEWSFKSPPEIPYEAESEKCTFGVASEKFLGYLVTEWGIKANPDQISAILNMKSSTCVKKVLILNGCLAALNWFLN